MRLQRATHELNRGVLSLVHAADHHQVLVYADLRHRGRVVDRDTETDALVLFMYFLLVKMEEVEGEGTHADLVVHQTEAPMPPLPDLRAEVAIFSTVVGLAFPALFDAILVCCGSTSFYRGTCAALAERAGLALSPAFLSPDDLISRYGRENVPRLLGGDYDVDTTIPVGTLVLRFVQREMSEGSRLQELPGWEAAEEGDEDPEPEDPFEESAPSWATLMATPLRLPTPADPAATTRSLPDPPTALRMWGTALLGVAMAYLLHSPTLLGALVLLLIHACVTYQRRLQVGARQTGGPLAERVVAEVLTRQLDLMARCLEPMSMYCVPQQLSVDEKSILAFWALDREAKHRVKGCVQFIQATLALLPPDTHPTPESDAVYRRTDQTLQWLRTITTAKVTCLHCGRPGTMDFLDAHLRDGGDAARAKLQHSEKYSARRRAKHSKGGEETQRALFPPPPLEISPTSFGSALSVTSEAQSPPLPAPTAASLRGHASLPILTPKKSNTMRRDSNANLSTSLGASSPIGLQSLSSTARSSRSDLKINDVGPGYDRHAKNCMSCDKKFGAFTRRHWCRRCRKTICAGCAAVSLSSLKRKNPQCMCKTCAQEWGAGSEEYTEVGRGEDDDSDG